MAKKATYVLSEATTGMAVFGSNDDAAFMAEIKRLAGGQPMKAFLDAYTVTETVTVSGADCWDWWRGRWGN